LSDGTQHESFAMPTVNQLVRTGCNSRKKRNRPRALISGMTLDVADDVLLADLVEIAGASRAYLTRESADDRQVTDDGLRCQATAVPVSGGPLRRQPLGRGVGVEVLKGGR